MGIAPSSAIEPTRNILVVTPHYAAHGGNTERVAAQLISHMDDDTHFRFIWASEGGESTPPAKGPRLLPLTSFAWLAKLGRISQLFWSPRSKELLRKAVASADIVWLHDTASKPTSVAFRLAQKLGKATLITQHSKTNRRTGWLSRLLTQHMLPQAHQTTFSSDTVAEFYYRRVPFAAPVKIIPNGVDTAIFSPPSPARRKLLRTRFALRDDQPVLLFAGSFTAEDGLPALRYLAQAMPGWRFWIAGEGCMNPERWFQPNIQVFRKRDDEGMAELYQAADLLIVPHNNTSFPLAAQEAMACGLPVMCSPVTAGASQFAKSYLWRVEVRPNDPKYTAALWAAKLRAGRSLLPLKEAKTELADIARTFWEWPKIAGYYDEILCNLAKTPRHPGQKPH